MKNKSHLFFAGIIIAFLLILVLIQSAEEKRELIEFRQDFNELKHFDSINNMIESKPRLKKYRILPQSALILLDNDEKWIIHAKFNPVLSNIGIDEVLEPGDIVFKRSGSDTIWVQKHYETSGYQYFFILRQIDENNNK